MDLSIYNDYNGDNRGELKRKNIERERHYKRLITSKNSGLFPKKSNEPLMYGYGRWKNIRSRKYAMAIPNANITIKTYCRDIFCTEYKKMRHIDRKKMASKGSNSGNHIACPLKKSKLCNNIYYKAYLKRYVNHIRKNNNEYTDDKITDDIITTTATSMGDEWPTIHDHIEQMASSDRIETKKRVLTLDLWFWQHMVGGIPRFRGKLN